MTSSRRAAYLLLALASAGAGVIHLATAGAHLAEWRPLGLGFILAGVLQLTWAAAMVVRGSRLLLQVGAAGSLALVGIYLMSRTTGLPLGPAAFQPEAFGVADLVCCALEVPVAIGALLLARRPDALRRPLTRRLATVVAGVALMVGSATSVALAAPPSHSHGGHSHDYEEGCGDAPVETGIIDDRGVDTGVTSWFACRLGEHHK